jgi:hypothetical protein
MKNKYYISLLLVTLISSFNLTAQVLSNNPVINGAQGENPFLDGSTNFNDANSIGKGIVFPTTDLTTFTFKTDAFDGINFPTALNGMMVYNSATGNTLSAVNGNNGVVTAVVPGYYYFSNPGQTTDVTSGVWTPLSNSGIKNYSTTEIATSTSIDGKQVYVIKGTFHAGGINALVTIDKPLGMTGYYKMTTYQNGRTFRSEISSFDIDPLVLTNNVVLGNGMFTEVYPLGDYTYTLEYFKS